MLGEENSDKRMGMLYRTLDEGESIKFQILDEYTIRVLYDWDDTRDIELIVREKLKNLRFLEDGCDQTVSVHHVINDFTFIDFQLVWEYTFP